MSSHPAVAIVGASGYTGVELLRLLLPRDDLDIRSVSSDANAGTRVDALFPNLRGHCDLSFVTHEDAIAAGCEIVFFATPHGVAMQWAGSLLEQGVRVIDLSADFRLQDVAVWEQWYGIEHSRPELVEKAVYGLPELHREQIRSARLIANPGCYPTAVQLGFLPLLEAGLIESDDLIADCKSGISGAGRSGKIPNLLAEAGDNFKAYGVSGHRHLPEIAQGLSQIAGREVGLVFTPHLLPIIRGIHATLHARLKPQAYGVDLQAVFEKRFAHEPFVDVLPAGSHPETRSVRGNNTCRVAVHKPAGREDRVVVLVVEDNLVKGAAGQAVQNMNLMLGLPETLGLERPALMP